MAWGMEGIKAFFKIKSEKERQREGARERGSCVCLLRNMAEDNDPLMHVEQESGGRCAESHSRARALLAEWRGKLW